MANESDALHDGAEFEDRSDYLDTDHLVNWNVPNDFFQSIQRELIGTGSRLLEGPRGTGKTHQMKIANHSCTLDSGKPFSVFVTLNKYFHLEPLLTKEINATKIFHSWVLCKIILGACNFANEVDANYQVTFREFENDSTISLDYLRNFESIVETPYANEQKKLDFSVDINIANVISFLDRLTYDLGRKRTIILLDDAALTLTPEYFIEFLDIFRSLKTKSISPKASVYPGTTQYSPRFHVGHDAQIVDCWMSVDDQRYLDFMTSLIDVRFSAHITTISADILNIMKYAAFGVPRTLIGLLRSYQDSATKEKTTQARFNTIMEKRALLIETEYASLTKKMLQYEDIISVGWSFFKSIIEQIKAANASLVTEKLIEVGIQEDDQKMQRRMISFLKEAGLLFEIDGNVRHGNQREYRRYIPHILFLLVNRTFSHGRGFNSAEVLARLRAKSKKHPLRRAVHSLIDKDEIEKLKLNLPPCQKCGTKRLTEDQKFCHNCGSQLINKSAFEECMQIKISDLPLTEWQKSQLVGIKINTIGDFLTLPNPGGELRKAKGIGKIRSERISVTIQEHLTEILEKALTDFLS